ncbi:hypothetical protein Tco_1244831 [Tanacetum coccineum]
MKDLVESDQDKNKENIGDDEEEEVKDEFVKTPSNDSDETKITNKAKGDEDEEMDYTTSQLYDDGNENPEILQAIEDAYVILYTVLQKTKVPVTSSSHSFDLASKFLNFSDILHTDAEIVSLMDVHIHHEVPSKQTSSLLMMVKESLEDAVIAKESSQPQSSYERMLCRIEKIYDLDKIFLLSYGKGIREEKPKRTKMKTLPLDRPRLTKVSIIKLLEKFVQSEEPEFEVADSYMPLDQEKNLGNDDEEAKEKVASKRDSFTKPTQP